MKKIVYSHEYKDKIAQLRKYLDIQFGEEVRKTKMKEINKRIHQVAKFENIGLSVREIFGIDCDYSYIYAVGNYIFYTQNEETLYVIDIYNEREDIMWKMFGIKTSLD